MTAERAVADASELAGQLGLELEVNRIGRIVVRCAARKLCCTLARVDETPTVVVVAGDSKLLYCAWPSLDAALTDIERLTRS